jgi:hypothetical protein
MKSFHVLPMMVVISIAFLGCSNPVEKKITTAPQDESELGFIVSGATSDEKENFLNSFSNVQIREISNENIIMFEVLNSDLNTIRSEFPNSRIYKNEFIKFADVKNDVQNLSELNTLILDKNLNLDNLSSTNSFNLNTCKDENLKPIAKVKPLSANLTKKGSLNIGESIKLSSVDSQAHAFVGGKVKTAWLIMAPLGSSVPQLTFADQIEFTLDTMGYFQVYLVVQDQKSNCQFENVNISVTGNEPFKNVALSSVDSKVVNQTYIQKLGLSQAHQTSTGQGQLIAIVDSGVNYNHPYLSQNIFINQNEIPDNNIDDDKNGLVDDVHGWDFVFNDKFPFDDLGHGSHVAGLAAGKVFGVAPDAQILPIKAGNNSGMLDIGTTFKAIIYALRMKADVVNLSLGGERPIFREEMDLYKQALKSETILVAAAGNGAPSNLGIFLGVDIDNRSYAPAGVDLENIISVASLNNNDSLAYYSNFGLKKINVATYGGEDFDLKTGRPYDGQLFSTYIENSKKILFFGAQGTSMAAPVATGIVALVRSVNPNLTPAQVKLLLETSGTVKPDLARKIKSGRVLTAESAVKSAASTLNLIN